jgi:hypothetical protein
MPWWWNRVPFSLIVLVVIIVDTKTTLSQHLCHQGTRSMVIQQGAAAGHGAGNDTNAEFGSGSSGPCRILCSFCSIILHGTEITRKGGGQHARVAVLTALWQPLCRQVMKSMAFVAALILAMAQATMQTTNLAAAV